ncbi:MAG: hypothetical protein JRJ02_13955 [Deltaproteobacteria bacterium]|nr:hypothetical protein [Deltaproteobacteria bacterium]
MMFIKDYKTWSSFPRRKDDFTIVAWLRWLKETDGHAYRIARHATPR